MHKVIKINQYSTTPKYKQIINSILTNIEEGQLHINDKLPSVNRVLIDFDVSRDTVVKAYDYLKGIGVVQSVPGKGYFICNTETNRRYRVCLLFNKLSTHKKIIYDNFAKTLGDQASIDFFIYNNDFGLFRKHIHSNLANDYSHFVIIPHFLEGGQDIHTLINQIPDHKLILLDKKIEGVTGTFGAIYQDFAADIYFALSELLEWLKNYQCIKIIFPAYSYHPQEILAGFKSFCTEYAFEYKVIDDIKHAAIQEGDVFINLMEDDLVTLIKRSKELGFKVGNTIGIISYNDTPLKEILLNGITVISTDFQNIGEKAGQMILENKREQLANPFYVVVRHSL